MFSVRSISLAAKAKHYILSPWVWRTSTSTICKSSDNKLPIKEKKFLAWIKATFLKHHEAFSDDDLKVAGKAKNYRQFDPIQKQLSLKRLENFRLKLNDDVCLRTANYEQVTNAVHPKPSERQPGATATQALCDSSIEDESLIPLLSPIEPSRGVEQHELLAVVSVATPEDRNNMKRNALLGDLFLNFATTSYLIQHNSDWIASQLTIKKDAIVSNRNLCNIAIDMQLREMIQIHNFQPKYEAAPERTSLRTYVISDKTCADCVEAMLGCYVKSIGVPRSFKILETFNILRPVPGKNIMKMLDQKQKSPRIRSNITDNEIDSFLIDHETLEKNIGYTFKDRAYLLQALTHPSYEKNHITGSHEKLKFQGDIVFQWLVMAYIFGRCPNMVTSVLADLYVALINHEILAYFCVRRNIHKHMFSASDVSKVIANFSKFQASNRHEITEPVKLLMEENGVECKMAEYVSPIAPKSLSDVFKALVGGIYLDSGNDLVVTWSVIYKLMGKELGEFMRDVPIHPVEKLRRFPNANPHFEKFVRRGDVFTAGLRFNLNGEIRTVHGLGRSHAHAKTAAATAALYNLQKCVRE